MMKEALLASAILIGLVVFALVEEIIIPIFRH